MVMLRRFSQLAAHQPKSIFRVSSGHAGLGARQFCAPEALGQRHCSTTHGNMTDTGMYNWRVAAIHNALAKRGKASGPLTVEDLVSLGHLDQYHYMGTEACDELIEVLGFDDTVNILDIGSGIGGPARYLSMKTGCSITGVELQKDLNDAARELTERVGLSEKVKFVTGDFVERFQCQDADLQVKFDHMISLLVILHVADRQALLQASYDSLKPGGTFLIEDFALVGDHFTAKESSNLTNVVSANTVTSKVDYIAALEAVGFVDIEVVDLSEQWQCWTKARHESYRASREETVQMHGEKLFNDRVSFYEVIDELFAGGNLGGVRISGRRRGTCEERLHHGRKTARSITSTAVLNELGSTLSK